MHLERRCASLPHAVEAQHVTPNPPAPPPLQVAEKNPSAIITTPVNIAKGLSAEEATKLAEKLNFKGDYIAKAAKQFQALYKLFIATDATQVEINPLAEGSVPGGTSNMVIAVDAKLNFDDNAAFRQKPIYDLRDRSMEDPRDVAAMFE